MSIDHDHTLEPVCPYCGREERDAWEINFGPSGDGDAEVTCGNCERDFKCYRHVSIDYSTEKIEPRDGAEKGRG